MTFEEAKQMKKELNEKVDYYSAKLNSFPKNHMGLCPDHIRVTPEYKEADREFKNAFSELRNFNGWFVKEFMKKKKTKKVR